MDTINNLQKLGLTLNEAIVYESALGLGKFSVIQISRKTNLKRPTCYLILDSLLKKGLVVLVPQSKKLLYEAETADVLIEQAKRNAVIAEKVAPVLNSLKIDSSGYPNIKFYSGQEGVRNIYEDLFKSKIKSYKYIGATEEVVNMAGADFIKDHIYRRLQKNIKVQAIRIRDKEIADQIYSEDKKYLREIKYAPKGFALPGIIFLYGEKVAFVSSEKGNFGFVIQGKDFHKAMSMFFDMIWSVSS